MASRSSSYAVAGELAGQVGVGGQRGDASLFGAHGGALDRLDAAFFTLVAGYYVWLAML